MHCDANKVFRLHCDACLLRETCISQTLMICASSILILSAKIPQVFTFFSFQGFPLPRLLFLPTLICFKSLSFRAFTLWRNWLKMGKVVLTPVYSEIKCYGCHRSCVRAFSYHHSSPKELRKDFSSLTA